MVCVKRPSTHIKMRNKIAIWMSFRIHNIKVGRTYELPFNFSWVVHYNLGDFVALFYRRSRNENLFLRTSYTQ